MALGVNFLSKTKIGGMKDIMGVKTQGASSAGQNNVDLSSALANNNKKAEAKPDVASMDSSSLLNYVYNNGFKNNEINLPSRVEFNGQNFDTHGEKFDKVVKEICKQTGEGRAVVESELKKKYVAAGGAQGKGTSLNMQA